MSSRLKESLKSSNLFARSTGFIQTWWPLMPSKQLKVKQVKSIQLPDRRLVIYRAEDGQVVAMNGVCPHMGANLAHGKVIDKNIRCAFHHLTFAPDGGCLDRHCSLATKTYPVTEQWGFIWVFNGCEPSFSLPELDQKQFLRFHIAHRPFPYHAHLVIANLYDLVHFRCVHKLEVSGEVKLAVRSPFEISVSFLIKPLSAFLSFISGTAKGPFRLQSTIFGDSVALIEIDHRFPYYVCYACRPAVPSGCHIETFVFVPRKWQHLAAYLWLAFLHTLQLLDDNRLLSDMAFAPNFTAENQELKTLVNHINCMPTYSGEES